MKLWKPIPSAQQGLDFFKTNFYEFKLEQTANSLSLTGGRFRWLYSSERFWPRYLRELGKIKREVKGNVAKVESFPAAPVRAYRVNASRFLDDAGSFSAEELDLSRAYLTAAHVLGLISEETLERVCKIRKVWRLRLLGAIARRRVTVYYQGGAMVKREVAVDPALRHAWLCICHLVDNVQQGLARKLGAAFLFYWYDNLFCDVGHFSPAVLETCSEFTYRIAARSLEWKSRPASLAVRVSDDGRVFWLPSLKRREASTLPALSPIAPRAIHEGDSAEGEETTLDSLIRSYRHERETAESES